MRFANIDALPVMVLVYVGVAFSQTSESLHEAVEDTAALLRVAADVSQPSNIRYSAQRDAGAVIKLFSEKPIFRSSFPEQAQQLLCAAGFDPRTVSSVLAKCPSASTRSLDVNVSPALRKGRSLSIKEDGDALLGRQQRSTARSRYNVALGHLLILTEQIPNDTEVWIGIVLTSEKLAQVNFDERRVALFWLDEALGALPQAGNAAKPLEERLLRTRARMISQR